MHHQHKSEPVRLLFVCSRNQWRSPTAEVVWRNRAGYSARSAGTSKTAKKTLSAKDVLWADMIFVMEKKHKSRLLSAFAPELAQTPVHVLDIPDDYAFMDPELIDEIESRVSVYLQIPFGG